MKLSTGGIVAIVFMSFIFIVATTITTSYINAYNTGVKYEANIEKFHKESQNTLSSYTLKIKEMVQVPDMYMEKLQEFVKETFQGRYGESGSKATFQWVKENNIQVDSEMFKNLQIVMESGRNEFKLSQTKKLDICSNYEKSLNYFWSGTWLRIAGYPKKDLNTICRIIIDSSTQTQFNTGVATEIKLK